MWLGTIQHISKKKTEPEFLNLNLFWTKEVKNKNVYKRLCERNIPHINLVVNILIKTRSFSANIILFTKTLGHFI